MDSPTQDESLMAALAHVAIILPFWGIAAPIIIWATQKDKSKFVSAHAIQAIGWQIFEIVLWLFAGLLYLGSFLLMILGVAVTAEAGPEAAPAAFVIPLGVLSLAGLMTLIVVVLGMVAAYHAFQGRPYRYPLIGHHLDRFEQ